MTTRQQLKQWFSNLKKPNQNQFWAWIDSFVHKEDKIPMDSIEGLDAALQGTASDAKLEGHLTDEQAHQALFAQKVDKEDGKGLSTNDYSDEEKQKLSDTANKVAVNLTVTGDVNKIATLTFADGTTLKAPFKDLGIENVADVKMNSLNFNTQTGVLTGVRSDGQEITANLDGRYSLIEHTHSYNELEDLPTLLPDAPNDGNEYIRFNNTWKAFTGWQFRQLSDTEHLDDIKYPGLFGQYNSGAVTIARGFPNDEARGGHILSLPMTLNPSTRTLFHVFFSAGTKNAGDYTNVARIYMRSFVNNEKWLPWREFDGGKVHTLTDAVQNISQAFKGFPTNDSTFVIDKATTVTVPKNYGIIKYVKNTSENLTFSPASGVDIIGDTVVTAPVGTLVYLICSGTTAFVYYYKDVNTENFIEKTSEATKLLKADGTAVNEADFLKKKETRNLLLSNGDEIARTVYIETAKNNKNIVLKDGTELAQNKVFVDKSNPVIKSQDVYQKQRLDLDSGIYCVEHPNQSHSEILVVFNSRAGSASALHLVKDYINGSRLRYRNYIDNVSPSDWHSIANLIDTQSRGVIISEASFGIIAEETNNAYLLTGSGTKTVNLNQLPNGRIVAFKKCYNGGVVNFTTSKQVVMRGATSFNGADGSTAVVTIVDNKCYIDINNYQ